MVERPKPKPAAVPRKLVDAPSRRRQLQAKLDRELAGLRAAFEEAVEQFEMKIQSRLADLQDVIQQPHEGKPPIPLATLDHCIKAFQGLKLKPAKGRLKDLVAMAEVVAELRLLLKRE